MKLLILIEFILSLYGFVIAFALWHYKKKNNKTARDIKNRNRIIDSISYWIVTLVSLLIMIAYAKLSLSIDLGLSKEKALGALFAGNFGITIFVGMFLLFFSMLISRFLQNLCNRTHNTEIVDSLEDFALYLRPFEIDKHAAKFDDCILNAIGQYYTCYAIGNPGSIMQSCAAERIYATDDEWKINVEKMIESSKIIILHIGVSDGLSWEIGKIKDLDVIKKSIFLFTRESEYKCFLNYFSEIQGCIPNYVDGHHYAAYLDIESKKWHFEKIDKITNDTLESFYETRQEIEDYRRNFIEFRPSLLSSPLSSEFSTKWAFLNLFLGTTNYIYFAWRYKIRGRDILGMYLLWFILSCIIFAAGLKAFACFFVLLFSFYFGGKLHATARFSRPWASESLFLESYRKDFWVAAFSLFVCYGAGFLQFFVDFSDEAIQTRTESIFKNTEMILVGLDELSVSIPKAKSENNNVNVDYQNIPNIQSESQVDSVEQRRYVSKQFDTDYTWGASVFIESYSRTQSFEEFVTENNNTPKNEILKRISIVNGHRSIRIPCDDIYDDEIKIVYYIEGKSRYYHMEINVDPKGNSCIPLANMLVTSIEKSIIISSL